MINARLGRLKTTDGVELHYEYWVPEEPQGVLVVVHGIGEHCGRYAPLVRYFAARGFLVALYDQRGHGKSGGVPAHAESFEVFLEDLATFVAFTRNHFSNLAKWFLVGHSFGGQVALQYVATKTHSFAGLVAASPNLELASPIPKWKLKINGWLEKKRPMLHLSSTVQPRFLSHDPKVVDAYVRDPLVRRYVTVRLGKEILASQTALWDRTETMALPILFLHGTADNVCSPQATQRFYEELAFQDKEIRLYDGLYHELFNEVVKERVMEDVHQWLKRH